MLGKIAAKSKILILLLVAFPALAEDKRAPTTQKRISINFEDEMVNGEDMRPEMNYLFFRKGFDFNKLVKVRSHFIREVKKGKEDFGGR